MGNELVDLEVQRLDAVDRPVTKRKFVIMKAEGDPVPAPVVPVVKADIPHQEPAGATPPVWEGMGMVKSVLDAFDGQVVSEVQASALDGLAKAAGSKYKAGAPGKEVDPANAAKPGDAHSEMPAMRKAVEATNTNVEALTKTVGGLVTKMDEMLTKGVPIAKSAPAVPPKSTQGSDGKDPVEKAAPRKLGEGLFKDIVFADK